MSIFCCGCYHISSEKRILQDTEKYKDRVLEIITCPKCGQIKALMVEHRKIDNKIKETRPKKGKVQEFIKKYSVGSWFDANVKNIKCGTLSNMHWNYSDGKRNKQWVKDFNEVSQFKNTETIKTNTIN